MKNIVLIGFMGSGKTVISNALAKKTNRMVIDTDCLIEQQAGMRIKRIFAMYGEPYFRKLETKAVLEAAKAQGAIISTGGGIVMRQGNITALKESGAVVYLKNSFEVSARRLKGKTDRPLFNYANLEKTKVLFKKRQAMYSEAADLTVLTEKKTISRVADEIMKKGGKKGWL
jgi:shikimate kinase